MKTSVMIRLILIIFFSFSLTGLLKSANPYNADIVVAIDGSGDVSTIQAAIDAAPVNSSRRTVIYVKRGTYKSEKVLVPADKINLTLIGESRDETIISYHIYDCTAGKCPTADAAKWTGENILTSATLTILADGFRAENLTIQNTAGPVGQALAITVRSDKVVFVNCNMYGYQDTLYFWSTAKRSYFKGCLVTGRTDYIYGSGTVFFESCEIRSFGGGWITAPSTGATQPYGFVFDNCSLTYATGSPRAGDDGGLVRLGRPWHGSPKVAFLNTWMCAEIHPKGWGDIWDMDSVKTASSIKLLEYKNTGPGANMSGRAAWTTLRSMTDEESLNYSAQKVMAGSDGWDPTAEAPAVQTYLWTGKGLTSGWLVAENWFPIGVPSAGESAVIDTSTIVSADNDTFAADLNLGDSVVLNLTGDATVTYLMLSGGSIRTENIVSLSGKISTKKASDFRIKGTLDLKAALYGVHPLEKSGTGTLLMNAENKNYSGLLTISEGNVDAKVSGSLGKGSLSLKNGANLLVNADNCLNVTSRLSIFSGAKIVLNKPLILNQVYINDVMLEPGVYGASTHPAIFSGTGNLIVGRPTSFVFQQASGKRWSTAANYIPALLPLAGDTAIVEIEMEADAVPYSATILLQKANIRLVGNAVSTGDIIMSKDTKFTYATGGAGFSLSAKIKLLGDILLQMGGNSQNNALTFTGSFVGASVVTAYNYGSTAGITARLVLGGDNSLFSGIWDGTKASRVSSNIAVIEGTAENAFGSGKIQMGAGNKVCFSHEKAGGALTELNLASGTMAKMNTNGVVGKLTLGGTVYTSGNFDANSHPAYFEGTGTLTVGSGTGLHNSSMNENHLIYKNNTIQLLKAVESLTVFNNLGQQIFKTQIQTTSIPVSLTQGSYLVRIISGREIKIQKLTVR